MSQQITTPANEPTPADVKGDLHITPPEDEPEPSDALVHVRSELKGFALYARSTLALVRLRRAAESSELEKLDSQVERALHLVHDEGSSSDLLEHAHQQLAADCSRVLGGEKVHVQSKSPSAWIQNSAGISVSAFFVGFGVLWWLLERSVQTSMLLVVRIPMLWVLADTTIISAVVWFGEFRNRLHRGSPGCASTDRRPDTRKLKATGSCHDFRSRQQVEASSASAEGSAPDGRSWKAVEGRRSLSSAPADATSSAIKCNQVQSRQQVEASSAPAAAPADATPHGHAPPPLPPPLVHQTTPPFLSHLRPRAKSSKGFLECPVQSEGPFGSPQRALSHLSPRRVTRLPEEWDHIYLPFIELVWGRIFLGIPLQLHFLLGGPTSPGILLLGLSSLRQMLRRFLRRRLGAPQPSSRTKGRSNSGVREGKPPEQLLADLFLETTCAIFCDEQELMADDSGDGGGERCRFHIPNAASICHDGRVKLAALAGEIDLTRRVAVGCTYDGEPIPFADACVLLFLVLTGQVHTQIHAYANWGLNVYAPHPFVRRMSVCTVMYNYFGSKGFPQLCGALYRLGCFHVTSREVAAAVLGRAHLQSTPTHKHIHALRKYSHYVDFIVRVRVFFLREFGQHQLDFPGIDGESLFLGTVLHSTDHGNATHFCQLADLRCDDDAFAANLEMTRLVCANFVDRQSLATLAYDMRFKHAGHPLFRDTYDFAAKIDQRLADEMECAIVR